MNSLPLNPRSLGDLVGLGFRLFRSNWNLVLVKFLVPSIVMSVSMSSMEWCFVQWVKTKSLDSMMFGFYMVAELVLMLIIVVCQWEIALRSVAYIRYLLGASESFDSGYESARDRQWPIMTVYGISFLLPFFIVIFSGLLFIGTISIGKLGLIGKLLCIVFGFLEGAILVLAFSYAALYTSLCFLLISLEELKVKTALYEGYALANVAMTRGLSFICLLVVSVLFVVVPISLPVGVLSIWEGYMQGNLPYIELPVYVRALDAVSNCLINIISVGVVLSGIAVYYRDVKMRRQGLDIIESLG